MRSITDQLLEIVRSGLATVKTLNDSTQDAINVTAIRRFFPAIDPGRLGAAWKDRPGTSEPDSVFERIKRVPGRRSGRHRRGAAHRVHPDRAGHRREGRNPEPSRSRETPTSV